MWVSSFCVVTFDNDLGQTLELQYPAVLTEAEQQAVAFLSFPDSNSFNAEGDVTYLFRMRKGAGYLGTQSGFLEREFYYGFVYFRLCRDASKPRGYFQKSLVVLTTLPYVSLFKQVASATGPLYFSHGESVFESAKNCIDNWPPPSPSLNTELPFLGTVLPFHTPMQTYNYSSEPRDLEAASLPCILEAVDQSFPGLFQDLGLVATLGQQLCTKHLWSLWELVLTGQGLMVVADSPELSSETVLALVSLTAPLSYMGDFRPYITLFDADFKEFQAMNDGKTVSQAILGTTNPFFVKTLNHWPNFLHISRNSSGEIVSQ